MPLHLADYTPETGGWAIWRVTEQEDELQALLPACGRYRNELSRLHAAPKRRMERLAVRVLMYTCWGREEEVAYTADGRPYLKDGRWHISISHTQGYAALCWHPAHTVGIDIECLRPKALGLTARFMHPDEHAEGEALHEALLHWSAKETLYKMLPRQEGTDFARHLFIHPFTILPQGTTCGTDRRNPARSYRLDYLVDTDFVLTWHHQ